MKNAAFRFQQGLRRRPESHPNQAQLTPEYVLEPVRRLLGGIELDPCTEPDNPVGAERFYCLPIDGCLEPWDAATIYCNPPYGEVRDRWVNRCIAAAREESRILAEHHVRGFGKKVAEFCSAVNEQLATRSSE